MDGKGDVLLQKGEGESYWVLGDLYTLFITPAGLEEFFYAIGTPGVWIRHTTCVRSRCHRQGDETGRKK